MGMPPPHRKSPTTLKSIPTTDPAFLAPDAAPEAAVTVQSAAATTTPLEIGGFAGPEPTRFGDWEKNGRCIDF
jgi:hypothetical protein